ncbi:MAG: class I SAM-dependent methyltransferase, partial [Bacteroidia bacterium]|nr:class I SAM-dependent methyltransferase [Bacteroidia bacterium]
MANKDDYILGTDQEELLRLRIQHEIWSEEAQKGWKIAGFRSGQTLLDLGCGPGYCSTELALIAGQNGKVIAIDLSANYIAHLQKAAKLLHLNIETINKNFNDMSLQENSIDGMYCRWALAWLNNPNDILE